MSQTGPRNLITDVEGLRVGHAGDDGLRSGLTVLLPDRPAKASADLRGGGPGTRETAAISDVGTIDEIHGLVFSGGSAYGLDAATGAQAFLRERGQGFQVADTVVPIVPSAILFDLANGGDKSWGRMPPYRDMAYDACGRADADFALGSFGAGLGATVERLKGGIGSASAVTDDGYTVGAMAAVNAAGNVTIADTGHFWAAAFEIGGEFGGHGWPRHVSADLCHVPVKGAASVSTTLAVVATDAALDKLQLKRIAILAQTGLARAIWPVHTPLDGDIMFALSTGTKPVRYPLMTVTMIGALAAATVSRAVARAVFEATAFPDGPPAYRDVHRYGPAAASS